MLGQTASPHPVLAGVAAAGEALKSVRDVQPVFMTPAEQQAAVNEIARLEARTAELKLRVLAAAGDAAEQAGARDVGSWLSRITRTDGPAARAETRLAEALDQRWQRVGAGMADGGVSPAQARVLLVALEALPDDLDPEYTAKAEAQLVAWCEHFRPGELRRLGRRILEVVAPDVAEAEEAKRLEHEEQTAQETCRITSRSLGNGATRGTVVVPDADWARFMTYLDSFTSPRKDPDAVMGEEDKIPYPRRLGQAFCALLEHLDPAKLPHHGGDATTVIVTMTLESLLTDLGTAGLLDGDLSSGANLSATEARRLACTAQIVPAVLGGRGEVLDLGRASRLYTPAQRKAMRIRDRQCRGEGCSIPATWCDAHHLKPWSRGGSTDLADGVLLCSYHHHRIHDRRHTHDRLANGDIRFHRRT